MGLYIGESARFKLRSGVSVHTGNANMVCMDVSWPAGDNKSSCPTHWTRCRRHVGDCHLVGPPFPRQTSLQKLPPSRSSL